MAQIMLCITAAPAVDENPDYRRGYLRDAEQIQFGVARAYIEDKKTGDIVVMDIDHVSSLLGRYNAHVSDEFYDQFHPRKKNPGDHSAEILLELLDTRTGGLTFYYHAPQAKNAANVTA